MPIAGLPLISIRNVDKLGLPLSVLKHELSFQTVPNLYMCAKTRQFLLQVVKTMEQQGQPVDKQRIKLRLEQMYSRQSGVKRASRHTQAPNENLERLKFWLGLENSYYG